MTVPTEETPFVQYIGDGVTELFAFNWTMIADSSILVFIDDVQSDYEREGNAVRITPAPAIGAEVDIYRATELSQKADFQVQEAFHGDKTEDALDKLILLKQETAFNVAVMNIFSQPFLDLVTINNDVGDNADIYYWDIDGGVFGGEVAQTIPDPGTVVSKPKNFVYFGFADPVEEQVLTTTLYPIEAIEGIQITCTLGPSELKPIDTDEFDWGHTIASDAGGGHSLIPTRITYGPDIDEFDWSHTVVSGTLIPVRITYGPDIDEVDWSHTVLSGTLVRTQVEAFHPDQGIQITCTLDIAQCSMTPV